MRVVITGAAGFAGHHLVEHLQERTNWELVGLCSFRHRGDSLRTENFAPAITTVHHADLAAPLSHRLAERIGDVDAIIHLAAESHVDRSIEDPVPFVENNIAATLHMLEYARLVQPRVFIQVSTDEVYGPAPEGTAHEPWSPIIPSNPYSASKAAQEAIAISYWRTYSVPVVLTNTMNMIGERQDAEKYVPMLIGRINRGERVTVHGSQRSVGSRFYLHARNHADALMTIVRSVKPAMFPAADRPNRFHIVGEREVDNLELAKLVAMFVGKPLDFEFEDFHRTRPGHDPRYALAPAPPPGWSPPVPFEESLRRTVEWTLQNPEWLR